MIFRLYTVHLFVFIIVSMFLVSAGFFQDVFVILLTKTQIEAAHMALKMVLSYCSWALFAKGTMPNMYHQKYEQKTVNMKTPKTFCCFLYVLIYQFGTTKQKISYESGPLAEVSPTGPAPPPRHKRGSPRAAGGWVEAIEAQGWLHFYPWIFCFEFNRLLSYFSCFHGSKMCLNGKHGHKLCSLRVYFLIQNHVGAIWVSIFFPAKSLVFWIRFCIQCGLAGPNID